MCSRIRIVAQEINDSAEVISEVTIFNKDVIHPESISNLGCSHKEQINILQSVQDEYLLKQSKIMQEHNLNCPKCNKKTSTGTILPLSFKYTGLTGTNQLRATSWY